MARPRRPRWWPARWRPAKYAALRAAWQWYDLPRPKRGWMPKVSVANLLAAEYGYQMGSAALLRQVGPQETYAGQRLPGGGRRIYLRQRKQDVDISGVLAAVAKRIEAERVGIGAASKAAG